MADQPDQELLIRYLLGELPPEERALIEQRYLGDPAYLERLDVVESELIERYLDGVLSQEQKIHFESQYLGNPQRRGKVEMAVLLARRTSSTPRFGVLRVLPYGLAAALLLSFVVWGVYHPNGLPAAVVLHAGGATRALGRPEQSVSMARNSQVLLLHLDLRGAGAAGIEHASLRAVEDETPVWSQKVHANPADPFIDVIIQRSVLEDRDYILTVESRTETVASYSFRLRID